MCIWLLLVASGPQEFDYETGPRSYLLVIEATDQVMTATANVIVTLFNINDNNLEYTSPSYAFSVSGCHCPIHTSITPLFPPGARESSSW